MVLIAVLLFGILNLISAEESIFYNGNIETNLANSYNAGDAINTSFKINNAEDFPIINAYIVVEIVQGCEQPTYPSQNSNCDNVFDEIILDEINIGPKSSVEIPFSYTLPSNLKSGGYRIDAFLNTKKTPIVGMPHIFVPGYYHYFTLEGTGDFPYAKISREKTNINNTTGPIGVGFNPNERFNLNIPIDANKSFSGLLDIKICDWDDTLCEPVSEKQENINLNKGENNISIELNSPENPGAYAIRIELKENNKIISLYRSRIIVFGEAAKIRKLYNDKYYYNNENAKISVLVGGSPDHYNNPVVKNTLLKVSLTDKINNKKYEKEYLIDILSLDSFFNKQEFEIKVDQLINFEVCAELSSKDTGKIYDNYCYVVDATKFVGKIHTIELEENFDEKGFNGRVCIKDSITKNPINSEIFFMITKEKEIVAQGNEKINECSDLIFDMQQKIPYNILIQDRDTNQDFNFNITYPEPKINKNILYGIGIAVLILIVLIIIILLIIKKRKNG